MVGYRILLVLLIGLSYIFAHEFGHYIMASCYGLDPKFVYGDMGQNSFLGFVIGVSHATATSEKSFFIILGATLLPLLLLVFALGIAVLRGSEESMLFVEVYLLMILINLIPFPGAPQLDANRMWSFLLG